MSPKPHICVIGAGISGLRCAEVLLLRGFQVTILEARNRIGGRICQSEELGYTVDIGPNWIHKSDGHGPQPILSLAQKTNTILHTWNNNQAISLPSGDALSSKLSDKLSTLLWQLIAEAQVYSKSHREDIDENQSLYDWIVRKGRENLESEEEREILGLMSEMWGAYIGTEVKKQSLKFVWMEEVCGGEELFVASNFSAILSEAARIPLERAKICLNTKVIGISTSPRETKGGRVEITTEKGEKLHSDEVVMTTPLGWLKRHLNAFSPPLPARLISGIEGISVGHLEKVYITFPTPFWLPLEPEAAANAPCYTNHLRPSFSSSLALNPNHYPIEHWNLAQLPAPHNHATLIFYLYGELSHHLVNITSGKSMQEKFEMLLQFFKPYIQGLPNFSPSNVSHKPTGILLTTWQTDLHSGFGSYCNFQTGSKDSKGDVEAIRYGVPGQRLWFAGEHTSSFDNLGTVNGAYVSGEEVAERICRLYSSEDQERIEGNEGSIGQKNEVATNVWKRLKVWVASLKEIFEHIWRRTMGRYWRMRRKERPYEEV